MAFTTDDKFRATVLIWSMLDYMIKQNIVLTLGFLSGAEAGGQATHRDEIMKSTYFKLQYILEATSQYKPSSRIASLLSNVSGKTLVQNRSITHGFNSSSSIKLSKP